MKINLAPIRKVIAESGFKALTEAEIIALTNGNTSTTAYTVTTSPQASIVIDLGNRYLLSELFYYRTRATTDTITVFGKQSETDIWTSIPVTNTTTYTYCNLSGPNRYSFIRVRHVVTAGSSTVKELEVYTDDSDFSFGKTEQGSVSEFSMSSSTEKIIPQAVFIKNNSSLEREHFFLLDGADADSANLKVSSTLSGTYYGLYENSISIPTTYPWSSGSLSNVSIVSNTLKLTTGVSGTYFTPVMDLYGAAGRRLFWKSTLSGTNEIDIGTIDNVPTIQVRFSNASPTDSWTSGQLSTDGLWSVVSGSLPFITVPNNFIFDVPYRRYFQARVELRSPSSGQTSILNSIGIESAASVNIPAGGEAPAYVRASGTNYIKDMDTSLLSWYFNDQNSG
jgi:hypothetical protein